MKKPVNWKAIRATGIMLIGCGEIGLFFHSWQIFGGLFFLASGMWMVIVAVIENEVFKWVKEPTETKTE